MLRIVCIHGNANYSQSEILHFQFFLWGSMPSDPLRDQKFISSLHACKISGPCRSPFFYTCRVDSSVFDSSAPLSWLYQSCKKYLSNCVSSDRILLDKWEESFKMFLFLSNCKCYCMNESLVILLTESFTFILLTNTSSQLYLDTSLAIIYRL